MNFIYYDKKKQIAETKQYNNNSWVSINLLFNKTNK